MDAEELAHKLADFVQRESGAMHVQVLELFRLKGGAIQHNYALTVKIDGGTHPGRHNLVVRSDAPSRIAASLGRPEEFHVLKVAHRAGVTVPQALWLCDDPSLIGTAFYVMERVRGSSSPRSLTGGTLSDEQSRALTRQLGVELARLHRVRPPQQDLAFLTVPAAMLPLHRVRMYRDALEQIPQPYPVLEWSLNWLEDRAPESTELVLCHGDFRTGNYMVQDGRLTGILDWEFAAWGDPYEDLGWLCAKSWRFGNNNLEVGGVGHKSDLFDGYRELTDKPVDTERVLYWEAMAMLRWAIIALQQVGRHLCGEQPSLELALTGRMLPEIEYDLLNHIHGLGFRHD